MSELAFNPEKPHYDPEEEALRALLDGVASIDDFMSPQSLGELAEVVAAQMVGEDTFGTPIHTPDMQGIDYDVDIMLDHESATILNNAIDLYIGLLCRAADFDPDTIERPQAEVVRYLHSGQEFHDDNAYGSPSLGKAGEHLGLLYGVLTLRGEAVYSYIDPITGLEVAIPVKPGTLVVSRSGDFSGLPQVRHKVSPPSTPDRIALLLTLSENSLSVD